MSKRANRPTFVILGVLIALSLILAFVNVPMAQSSSQITAYKVVGSTDLSNPGSESFWSKIPWNNISLTANIPNAPTSGLTHLTLLHIHHGSSYSYIR